MRILRYTLFLFAIGLISCEQEFDKKKVCQNAHLLFFTHKAPTFTSRGFVIT